MYLLNTPFDPTKGFKEKGGALRPVSSFNLRFPCCRRQVMAEIAAAAVLIDVVALVKSAASETMARVRASRGLGALAGFSVVKTAPTRFLLFLSFVACTHTNG